MKLTVDEAAALLGKSPRTLRHLAQTGGIPAERMGNRWVFDRDKLTAADPDAAARRAVEVERVRGHVEAAIESVAPPPPGPGRDFYSVRDVTAFKVASQVLAQVEGAQRHELQHAAGALRDCLHRLADGFHQFAPDHKIHRLLAARSACCAAVAELLHVALHHRLAEATVWADALEREALGSLRGLIRQAERRGERRNTRKD